MKLHGLQVEWPVFKDMWRDFIIEENELSMKEINVFKINDDELMMTEFHY